MRRIGILIVILVSGLANAAINGGSYLVDLLEGRDPILTPVVSSDPSTNASPTNSSLPFVQVALTNPLFSGLGFAGGSASGGLVTGGQPSNANSLLNNNPMFGGGVTGSGDGPINTASIGEGGSFALVTFFAPNANGAYGTGMVNFSNSSLFFTPATGVSFAGNFPSQANNGDPVVVIPSVSEPMTWLMLSIGVGYLLVVSRTRNLQSDLGSLVDSYSTYEGHLTQASTKKLSVMILGLRGLPEVQGGIEAHVEQLAPLLVKRNLDVKVIVRSQYQPKHIEKHWNGLSLVRIWSPKAKATEAIVHTLLGVLYAAIHRPDVLHIHGIGPALLTPLCKTLGLNVVVTHHGPDYDRQKWGGFAKAILKLGELLGMRMADSRIVISNVIGTLVKQKHARGSHLIHNGVKLPELCTNRALLNQFGLTDVKYILIVSRLVPEKRHLDLIHAFNLANLEDCKLVIVGGSDHPDDYQKTLYKQAEKNPNIVMTGFQRGENLKALYTFADLFVLPSSHEGLSIALLEALSFGLPVLVSDIPANVEVGLEEKDYFAMGNVSELSSKLQAKLTSPITESYRQHTRNWISASYNWDVVANQTVGVYRGITR